MQKWPASYAGQTIIAQNHIRVILILQKFEKFCMLPNCSHLLTDFRTVFVFGMYALCVRDLDEHAGSFLAGSTLISRVEELLWA